MTGPDYTLRPWLELAPSAYPGRNYTVFTGSRAPSLGLSREEKRQMWMDKDPVGASQESDVWSIIVYAVSVVFFLVTPYRHGVSGFHHRGHIFCPGMQLPVQGDAVRAAILPSDTYLRGGRGRWSQAPRLRRGGPQGLDRDGHGRDIGWARQQGNRNQGCSTPVRRNTGFAELDWPGKSIQTFNEIKFNKCLSDWKWILFWNS